MTAVAGISLLLAACGVGAEDRAGQEDNATDSSAANASDESELPSDYEPTTLSNAHHVAPTVWMGQADQEWADSIAESSGGLIDIEFHWSGALAGQEDGLEALSSGTSQIGWIFPALSPGGFDVDAWISDLAHISSPHPVIGDMQAYAASIEWGLSTPAKVEEFRAQGVEPLLPHLEINAHYWLVCDEPVTSLDDAHGRTVRVAGAAWAQEAEAIGMSYTQLPAGDMFEALERGVIDCSLNPLRDMVDHGLLEAAGSVTVDPETSFSAFNQALGVNKDWWDSQPAEARQLIWESLRGHSRLQLEAAVDRDLALLEDAAEHGAELHDMESDLRDALIDNQQSRREAAVANAPDAVGDDAEAVIADFEETMDRWYDIIHDDLGYGEQIPATWDEFLESDITIDDIDFEPWADRLWDEVFAPRMPE